MTKEQRDREKHDVMMAETFATHIPTTTAGTVAKAAAERIREMNRPPQLGMPRNQTSTPVEHTSMDLPLAILGFLIGVIWAGFATTALFPALCGGAAGAVVGYFALPILLGLLNFALKLLAAASVAGVIYLAFKWFG